MLHVTNGDLAAKKIKEAGLHGESEVVPWRDVLHEGPVPALPQEQLAKVRAAYIAKRGWGDGTAVYNFFLLRNKKLLQDHDKIFLWFEPDLYDQLQLLQVLHMLYTKNAPETKVFLVQSTDYFENLKGEDINKLYFDRTELPAGTVAIGSSIWEAFTSKNRGALENELSRHNLYTLPHMEAALKRLLEEYPSARDGLGRTERQILRILSAGERSLKEVFLANQKLETWKFLTDSAFADYIERLSEATFPLICNPGGGPIRLWRTYHTKREFWEQSVILTKVGKDIFATESNFVAMNGIDRWIGGVHLLEKGASPAF